MALALGRVSGLEALIRWNHPTRGLVMPSDFLPAAEETGLIVPIGYWTLEEVCRQVQEWTRREPSCPPPIVAVNVSVRQLLAPEFCDRVVAAADAYGVPHGQLELEITESVMMTDPEATRRTVERLKALGFRISIDDFGTGYSSLSHLQRLPVDRLKLDRSFLEDAATQAEAQAIIESVIVLAGRLDLEVVAEGIETAAQLERVRLLHCGFGQGYYFSRPVPPGACAAWDIPGASPGPGRDGG